MKKPGFWIALALLVLPSYGYAHHGGITLAFGPGTPIEAVSPLTLPEGGVVLSGRMEQVEYQNYSFADPENKDSFTFLNVGVSYGIKPYLSASVLIPYNIKRQDSLGSIEGVGDIRVGGILGFHHESGKGLKLNSQEETAVSMEGKKKTFFAFYGSFTLPTGEFKKELGGEIDPGMQSGFGSPSFTFGFSAARHISGPLSAVFDTSYDIFTKRDNFRFGDEWRVNLAGVYELYGKPEKFLGKVDGILELNLLNIGRDQEFGEKLRATGGTILYLSPGMRFSFPSLQNANLGIMVKFPIIRNLNEKDEQQGSEGLEKYRAIAALSFYF